MKDSQPLKYGVLMVASVAKYMDQAAFCLHSLKTHNPELPVALMTLDGQAASGLPVDLIMQPSQDAEYKRYYKDAKRMSSLKTWLLTSKTCLPYEITLYLDTDTFVRRSLDDLFSAFDKSGASIGYGLNPDVKWIRQDDRSLTPKGLVSPIAKDPHSLNGGILMFRNCPNTYTTFRRLRRRFIELSDAFYTHGTDVVNDQGTWREILPSLDQKDIFVFDSLTYNATPFVWKYLAENGLFDSVAIFHGHDLFRKRHLPLSSIVDEAWIRSFPYITQDAD